MAEGEGGGHGGTGGAGGEDLGVFEETGPGPEGGECGCGGRATEVGDGRAAGGGVGEGVAPTLGWGWLGGSDGVSTGRAVTGVG